MNQPPKPSLSVPPRPVPALDSSAAAPGVSAVARDQTAMTLETGRLLARLARHEASLYAVTRDWRYDAAGRKFVRLHALLDEQFTEIGMRLVKLAARSRVLGLRMAMGHSERAESGRAAVGETALETHMLRGLLDRHETLAGHLRAGKARAADEFHDPATTELLSELMAGHEKNAFMLRALLWETENTPA